MRLLVALVAVSACNGALGLDPVGVEPDDVDDDGVAFDNCRLVANADQLDSDDDGLGDACDPCMTSNAQVFEDIDGDNVDDGCDPCLRGPQHDEDHDGAFDACDNCPVDASSDQSDGDGDGIGDACDPGAGVANSVILFDAFAPPDPRWHSPPDRGLVTEPDALLAQPPGGVLRSPELPIVSGPHWYLEFGVELVANQRASIVVVFDQSGSGDEVTCRIDCDGQCSLSMKTSAGQPGTVQFPPPASLRVRIGRSAESDLSCEVVGVPNTRATFLPYDDSHFGFSLFADGQLRFTYAYVVR